MLGRSPLRRPRRPADPRQPRAAAGDVRGPGTFAALASDPEAAGDAARAAIELSVAAYRRHGPLLRAIAELAPGDPRIAAGYAAFRTSLRRARRRGAQGWRARRSLADPDETAIALVRLNESYLLDASGETRACRTRPRSRRLPRSGTRLSGG